MFYQQHNTEGGNCQLSEFKVNGKRIYKPTLADTVVDVDCKVKVTVNGVEKEMTNTVAYKKAKTPVITNISPEFGTSYGGTDFTITGSDFGSSSSHAVEVEIDNTLCSSCTIDSDTSISCTTAKRSAIVPNSFVVKIYPTPGTPKKYQHAINKSGKTFMYVDSWSDPMTWGGEFVPAEGDSVVIPKG